MILEQAMMIVSSEEIDCEEIYSQWTHQHLGSICAIRQGQPRSLDQALAMFHLVRSQGEMPQA
jgi:hypothetical protein